jgi:alkylation response protein AidB-like acyl-CoA dehydrogenase
MHLQLDNRAETFRAEVRAHVDEVLTPEFEERIYRSGVAHDDEFARGLVEKDLFAPNRSAVEVQMLKEELMYADAPVYLSETPRMVTSVIHHAGNPEMKARIVAGALAGEITIALGFSEPECGSDVAAARMKAVRAGDEWIINGSKMFTTNAHIADYVFLLTRTNPDKPKHRGLTMFLVPLDTPGIEAQPIWTLSGERTNVTFYSDVRVGDDCRIGEVDNGWAILGIALQEEHASGWGPYLARLLHHAEQWAFKASDENSKPRIADADVRRRLSRIAIDVEVSGLLQNRCAWMADEGQPPITEGPMTKLFSTEALVRAAEDVIELVGPDALRSYFEPTAPQGGRFEHLMRFSLGTTIYAGTSEVQRTIIAQRGLGLPR